MTPVCATCNDTHTMELRGESVPCTRCPTPCESCRKARGAYCESTPCSCGCHRKNSAVTRAPLTPEQVEAMVTNANAHVPGQGRWVAPRLANDVLALAEDWKRLRGEYRGAMEQYGDTYTVAIAERDTLARKLAEVEAENKWLQQRITNQMNSIAGYQEQLLVGQLGDDGPRLVESLKIQRDEAKSALARVVAEVRDAALLAGARGLSPLGVANLLAIADRAGKEST